VSRQTPTHCNNDPYLHLSPALALVQWPSYGRCNFQGLPAYLARDVITDLLPLYLAGEASAGTRALLEQYLREHPEFAAEVRGDAEKSAALLDAAVAPLPPDHEKATFDRVRRVNRTRQWLLAFALAGTMLPFSFAFTDEIDWIMVRDSPQLAAILVGAAVVFWIAYAVMGRKLRTAT
jgi:hypothetical protein